MTSADPFQDKVALSISSRGWFDHLSKALCTVSGFEFMGIFCARLWRWLRKP